MEQVTHYLLTPASQKNQAETLDALMRAMVQLPSYVERVLAGGRDLALVLLPLLNDLRAVRGSAAAVRRHAAAAQSQVRPAGGAGGARRRRTALTVAQWARRLRTRFQLGLVGWIRGERPSRTSRSSKPSRTSSSRWRPAAGVPALVGRRCVVEALRDGGLETGVSVKRLWVSPIAKSCSCTRRAKGATRRTRRSSC